jgi:hypothetical protein
MHACSLAEFDTVDVINVINGNLWGFGLDWAGLYLRPE